MHRVLISVRLISVAACAMAKLPDEWENQQKIFSIDHTKPAGPPSPSPTRSFWEHSSPDANPFARANGSTGLLTTDVDVCIGRRRRSLSSLPNGRDELGATQGGHSRGDFVRMSPILVHPFDVWCGEDDKRSGISSAGTTSDSMMSPKASVRFFVVQVLLYKRHATRPIKGAPACFKPLYHEDTLRSLRRCHCE